MNKSRAALTHLWPSLIGLAIIAGLVLFAWYPYPFLQFRHSDTFAILLIVIAVFIGPALTWFVYKKGKKGLLFDLIIIVLIQITAISWGTLALHQNRPYFMVFAVDRFDVLSLRDVDVMDITNPEFMDKPVTGPVLLYANMPKDERSFQKLLQEVMFEGKPDIQFRPEFWSLYTEKQKQVLEVSLPLDGLRNARPESINAIDNLVRNNGGDITDLRYVPAKLANGEFAAILDANSGEVIDTLVIDPWVN